MLCVQCHSSPHCWCKHDSINAASVHIKMELQDKCLGKTLEITRKTAVILYQQFVTRKNINPLKPKLNPICYLLALLGVHHFLYVSRIRVKLLTFRLLMSYIYGAPVLDVSRSHTTTQHSR